VKLRREITDDSIALFSGDNKILWIKESMENNEVQIQLGGQLISESAHEILDELMALVSVGVEIVVDFSDVQYISAACMKVFLEVQIKIDQVGKGNLKMIQLPANIADEFERTGTSELLWIE
jgi:anti-anti-sigma factor